MSLVLVYDSETSGLPLFNEPSDDPRQPHLVQLAAMLVDTETRKPIQALDLIIRPDGWEIPEEAARVHGITTEMAQAVGVSESLATFLLWEMYRGVNRVGHNESFDARIIRIALKRYMPEVADDWKAGEAECTARMATPYCQLPPTEKMVAAGRNHYKTPNLGEAYEHFTGETLQNAHSAMGDVLGCMTVYWAIKDAEAAKASANDPVIES